ncbi:MAG: helix-turn-helix domain-containing protein [Gallionella sp.]|jgi:excisionase family DNA binding protein|nr:helix-turn-helix domain-containing protein [Gallionella sp.]
MKNGDTHEHDRLLGVQEAAALLGLPISSLWALVAEGRLPRQIKIGRRSRWSRSALEEWIREQHKAAQAG